MKPQPQADVVVNIDAIQIDSIPLSTRDAAILKASTQTELGRLLASGGRPIEYKAIGGSSKLIAPAVQVPSNLSPAAMGRSIARSVFGSIQR